MFGIGLRVMKKSDPEKSGKLEYFRKKILDHLENLEKEEGKIVNKALSFLDSMSKGGYSVGTVRTWKGQKYVKVAPGDWRKKYDGQTRGAKMAISAIKKRIAAAKDEHEMMQIILANRDRFSDKEGHPLPFVQELRNYIEEQKTAKAPASQTPAKVIRKPKVLALPKNRGGADSQVTDTWNNVVQGWLTQGTGKKIMSFSYDGGRGWHVKVNKAHKERIREAMQLWRTHGYWADYDSKNGYIEFRSTSPALTKDELEAFIEDARDDPKARNEEAYIGEVATSKANRVKDLTGADVSNIVTDSSSIRHAYGKEAHNLEAGDFLLAVDVINTAKTEDIHFQKRNIKTIKF